MQRTWPSMRSILVSQPFTKRMWESICMQATQRQEGAAVKRDCKDSCVDTSSTLHPKPLPPFCHSKCFHGQTHMAAMPAVE